MRKTRLGSVGTDDTEYKLIIINLEQKASSTFLSLCNS